MVTKRVKGLETMECKKFKESGKDILGIII